jgi:hypothetical protein
VHALRHVHRLLVPGGTLVDLHPVTEEQVETGSGTVIGVLEEPKFIATDLPNAEASLQGTIRDGLFVLEDETEFDFLQHFDTVEELIDDEQELLASQPSLLQRIRAAAPPLVTREHVVLRRLRSSGVRASSRARGG